MKLRFLLLAVAGLGMFACAKDGAEGPAVPDGSKSIVLKIALPQTTRALPDEPYKTGTGATPISSVDVYFTDNNGIIQEVYTLKDDKLNSIKGTGLRFTGLENVARVYCVANCADVIGKGKSIKSFTKKLSEQKPEMAQSKSIFVGYDADITPFVADTNEPVEIPNYDTSSSAPGEGDQAYKAAVTIRPLISRIEWGKITIEESGKKVIYDNQSPAQPKYLIAWEGWQPTLVGIYQSNVYLNSNIFADAGIVADHFATIDAANDIENGAWVGTTNGATLAYSNYGTSSYNALFENLGTYNTDAAAKTACVPFHFFVPFDATATSTDNDVNTTEKFEADKKPLWHFQLQYADKSSYQYTVYKYDAAKEEDLSQYEEEDKVTGDEALSVSVDFIYPGNADNIAYVNVLKLLDGDQEITYQPGKIYTVSEIKLSPFNVSGSYTEVIDYNVIVKVSVADFESQPVTPGFN